MYHELFANHPTALIEPEPNDGVKHAAVAMVIINAPQPQLLLIKRAQRQGDPWSGHMALPGGRVEIEDATLMHTAIRECHEEVGLVLQTKQLQGRLSSRMTLNQRQGQPVCVHPFVFCISAKPPLSLSRAEVSQTAWVSLQYLEDQSQRTTLNLMPALHAKSFHAVNHPLGPIWGITLGFIDEMLMALSQRFPA